MRAFIISIVLAFISGCATEIKESYTGQPIEAVQIDYGRPSNIIEMQDGRRAYQWNIDSSGMMPMTNYNSGTVYGGGGFVNYSGTSTSYIPCENNCLYTMFATK